MAKLFGINKIEQDPRIQEQIRTNRYRKIAMIVAGVSSFIAIGGASMIPNSLAGTTLVAGTLGLGALIVAAPPTLWIGIAIALIGLVGFALAIAWAYKNNQQI